MTKRQRVAPKPVTMLQLWRQVQQKKFAAATTTTTTTAKDAIPLCLLPSLPNDASNNDEETDDWLQLRTGVFELSGEAGAGKTQVALSLCQRTAMRSMAAAGPTALYLSLGAGRLPKALQRLQQMACVSSSSTSTSSSHPWLFRLLTKPLLQRDDWSDFLREADTFFTQHQTTLRLVVVDSLADLVRDDFGQYTQFDRTTWLLAWVQRCQVLADRYQLTWLLINQQATCVSATTGVWESKPALGLAWAHAVQGSWICHRGVGASTTRRLVLHKSNRFPVGRTAHFVIQQSGVQRIGKEEEQEEGTILAS
eukprot:scaffold11159_cov157-Amphora_coffeaeformis.AAC.2